jgi:hypothetical protein
MKQSKLKIDQTGIKAWKNNNNHLYKEDVPTVYIGGHKQWRINNHLHRESGPAIEWADGRKDWYINGRRHRLDGPAVEWTNGLNKWYVNGKQCSQGHFPVKVIQFLLNCDEKIAKIILNLFKN